MAETSFNWKGWLFGLGLIVALFLLALAPLAISKWFPGQSYKPEMSFEMAVIESLAEKPKDYPAFVQGVMQRRELHEREVWKLRNLMQATPDEAIEIARSYEGGRHAVDSPIVWNEGLGADNVRKIYRIQFSGGGGCWGGGGTRGTFYVFVGSHDSIMGWYTTNASWRAQVLDKSK